MKKIIQRLNSLNGRYLLLEEPSLKRLVAKKKKVQKDHRNLISNKSSFSWFSGVEMSIILVAFLVFFILSHPNLFLGIIQTFNDRCSQDFVYLFELTYTNLTSLGFDGSAHFQNLITIHAGIGAVLIGLAFFIAQEITKNSPYKGLILLRRSKFFSILVAEICVFFLFIWGDVNFFSIIPVVIIAVFTIRSLYKTLELVSDNFYFNKEEKKMFFGVVRVNFIEILDLEIAKLIGNNILNKKSKKYGNLIEITPFSPHNKNDYLQMKAAHSGVFENFNFSKLNFLLSELQKLLPEEDFTLLQESSKTENTEPRHKQDPVCYFTPKYLSNLVGSESVVFWLRKDIFERGDSLKLKKLADKVIYIEKKPKINIEKSRNEISRIKLQCLDFIKDKKADKLGEIIEFYVKLIEDFYVYLELYGGGFSKKQAGDMRVEMAFGGLKPIRWISKDIGEIFEKGLASKDREVIIRIMHLPNSLLRYAIDYRDYLIFQEFSFYSIRLYRYALSIRRLGHEKEADFMIDSAWRSLKELSSYHLEQKIEEENYSRKDLESFSIEIIKAFQGLLKISFDNRDIISFKKFLLIISKLFSHIKNHESYSSLGDEQKTYELLEKKKKEMLFGVASWVLFKFINDKKDSKIKDFYNELVKELPKEVTKFTDLFIGAHSFSIESFWGWDNWEMEEHDDGEAHFIDILSKLESFYAINTLTILSSITKERLSEVRLPHSRNLAYLAEGNRSLLATLEDVKKDPKGWKFILNQEAIGMVDSLKKMLTDAKDAQEKEETEDKIKKSISLEKVQTFKKNLKNSFYQNHTFRNIFKHHNLYEDISEETYIGELKNVGINTLFDKAAFFEDWHINFVGVGEEFSRTISLAENREVFDRILEKGKLSIEKEEEFDEKLDSLDDLSRVIIISINSASWKVFEEMKRGGSYIPSWRLKQKQKSIEELDGIYSFRGQDIPVYSIYMKGNKRSMIVLRVDKMGILKQHSPLNKGDSTNAREDIFKIEVKEISHGSDVMKELFSKQPKWLKEMKNDEERVNYLKERVLIHVFERFEVVFNPDFEAFIFNVKD